ncbi:putative outer membrane protein [Nonlabens tegetincola]|uniref:Putative outer membrane protein n=1 Tax=Nonlabens tegetincola TaxID=323273 RepID=A0A090Q786_9FLAO|nr:RagB/SusD family nutrient uptake outer membrane protein [Nonlabens tegetincola]GAK98047.1 putative outer membrane protein [Nonlabens tegetincola]
MKLNKIYKIRIITLLIIWLFTFSSCEDLVDENPISEIGENNFYANNQDLLAAVISCYDGMQSFYRDQYFHWGEFRADNHAPSSAVNTTNQEIADNSISEGNGATRWADLYRTISRTNNVIANAPGVPGLNENYLAEALAIRARCYFDAIRVWGDVPLFTEPVESPSDAIRPATDAITILNDVIIPDMNRAQNLMQIPSDDFRFSKSSIYALQAEVYLYADDLPNAKTAIQDLIALGSHSLVTTPIDWRELFFNSNGDPATDDALDGKIQEGSELIWSIRYSADEEAGSGNPNRSAVAQLFRGGIPQFLMSEEIENKWNDRFPTDSTEWVTKYPTTDPALTRTVIEPDGMGGTVEVQRFNYGDWRYFYSRQGGYDALGSIPIGQAKTGKWGDSVFPANEDITDVVVYRYADMLLLLAEVEHRLNPGDVTTPLGIINQLRTARQLPQVTAAEFGATPDERLDYILDERQFELYGEAKRWWDLLRNDKAIQTMTPILQTRGVTVPLTQDRLMWPIFFEHLIENPLLNQNPGY